MARTYLERNLDQFEACGREELVKHALKALRESLPHDKELGIENTSLGVGGIKETFELFDGEKVRSFLDGAFEKGENGPGEEDAAAAAPAAESMDVDT